MKRYITALLGLALLVSCSANNSTYYFDPDSGNDANTGTSSVQPLRSLARIRSLKINPGDSILLKSGAVFTEKLWFTGKGAVGKPVVIGKYGGEKMPYLKGDGSCREMIHVYNSEYIVIRDLEISNKSDQPLPLLTGLLVELHNYGVAKEITVDNLYVHDVYGSLLKGDGYSHKDVGAGQAMLFQNLTNGEKDSVSSNFDGLLIQNCKIKDCQRNGIMMWGNWVRKHWNPNLRVVIRHNELDGVPGDGIVPVGCESPLVEYNVMKNCPSSLPSTEACDGIWPWSCDNAVIQYNIVSEHKSKVDGYGFDSDYNCTNSLFQYNLSYNNEGGFLLLCNSGGWPADYSVGNKGTVVRYNVSINDGIRNFVTKRAKGYFSPVIHITGSTKNSRIEHNLFYIPEKQFPFTDKRLICSDDWNGYADSTFFVNNHIFVAEPTLALESTRSTNNFFDDNLFIGKLTVPESGFVKYNGRFDRTMWYDPKNKNWEKLIRFLEGKSITLNGKAMKVLDIIGWKN